MLEVLAELNVSLHDGFIPFSLGERFVYCPILEMSIRLAQNNVYFLRWNYDQIITS